MNENQIFDFGGAAEIIKDAIVRSRYQAAKLVNRELLGLYYAVGRYVSDNSRVGAWGKGAIRQLSDSLQRELPGLRGFSESSIKRMREFYEQWSGVFANRPLSMGEIELAQNSENGQKQNGLALTVSDIDGAAIDLSLLSRHMSCSDMPDLSYDEFTSVGFTHHSEILAKEKSLDGRLFYIAKCANGFWSVEALKTHLRGELYLRKGAMPNNFLQTLSAQEQARRAMRSFKDEYLLDYINIEDDEDPDERVLERGIVADIKKFIMRFGDKFCFIGNQHRIVFEEQEHFIDLLFFNRELHCLVAIELKRGGFKPQYLGQLQFYLSLLDDYVRQPDENQSIGILLCKEANRSVVEFAVRDYTKPMGVATYKTRNDMPETWKDALPDIEDMRRLLEAAQDEGEAGN